VQNYNDGEFPSFEEFKLEVIRRAEAAYKAASPPDDTGGIAMTLASLAFSYAVTSHGIGLDLEETIEGLRHAWASVLQNSSQRGQRNSS
jgi:hypothetical protein